MSGRSSGSIPVGVAPSAPELIKLVAVGDGCIGKTTLLMSYKMKEFPETQYLPTVFDNYTVNTISSNKQPIFLNLWDTAGQEEYDRLRPLSYPGTDFFIICYSVGRPRSKDNVERKWITEIVMNSRSTKAPMFLVGLQNDLREDASYLAAMKRFSFHKKLDEFNTLEGAAKGITVNDLVNPSGEKEKETEKEKEKEEEKEGEKKEKTKEEEEEEKQKEKEKESQFAGQEYLSRPVTVAEGAELAKKIGCVRYMECSAKKMRGVEEIFAAAIDEVLENRQRIKKEGEKKSIKCAIL